MFRLEYDSLNFPDNRLPVFVQSVSKHPYGKKITLNDDIAKGEYRVLEFSNGCRAYVSNYIPQQDFELELAAAPTELALHINQIQAGRECRLVLNGRTAVFDDKIITSIFLTGTQDNFILSGTRGACINRLKISMPEIWLQYHNLFGLRANLLQAYLELQEERFFLDSLDSVYRSMTDSLMQTHDALDCSATEHIAMEIAARFFGRMNAQMPLHHRKAVNY